MPGTLSTTVATTGFAADVAVGFAAAAVGPAGRAASAGRVASAWRAVSPQPTTIAANKVAAMHFICRFIENRSCKRES
jgi:hypothetical protein